jgi:hypothetical protein
VLVDIELGRYREASRRLAEQAPLYVRFGDPATLTLRGWLEGKIARGLGRPEEAERHLVSARNASLSQNLGYDAALVTLDLASLYQEQGRPAAVKPLATAMGRIFESREVHREAAAALILFQRAAREQRLTAAFLTELRAYLERARGDAGCRFAPREPPAPATG